MSKRILFVGDLHMPVIHPKAMEMLKYAKADFKPDLVVSVGDILDQYNFSRYFKDYDAPNIAQELKTVKNQIKRLAEIFPEIKICYGNHDLRSIKRGLDVGLPEILFKSLNELIGAPKGFQWANHWIVDNIYVCHGEDQQDLRKAVASLGMNLVIGHAHSKGGEIVHVNNGRKVLWGANAGSLIDSSKYAFRYAQNHAAKAVNGLLFVEDNTPLFTVI